MRKDNIRDYATEAFRFWARHGCPSYEEAVERIKRRAINRAFGIDPEKALIYAEAEVEKASAGLCDIMACSQVFTTLDDTGRGLVCEAVRAVYMTEPWKIPKRGELSARVLAFALEIPLSERQVYQYLKQARELFAAVRGLRLEEPQEL